MNNQGEVNRQQLPPPAALARKEIVVFSRVRVPSYAKSFKQFLSNKPILQLFKAERHHHDHHRPLVQLLVLTREQSSPPRENFTEYVGFAGSKVLRLWRIIYFLKALKIDVRIIDRLPRDEYV
jgi:hypothetical protein